MHPPATTENAPPLLQAGAFIASAAALLLLTAATLGRGGEAGWAQGLVLLAGGLGLATAALTPMFPPRQLHAAALLWLLPIIGCWVQSLTLPAFAHPFWAEAAKALPGIGSGSIALDPYAAQSDALRLLAYGGFAALGLSLAACGQAQRATLAIAATIALFSLAALLLVPDQPGAAAGKVRHAADAAYPFTSRNTFCAFAGTGAVIAAANLAALPRRATLWWLTVLAICTAALLASHSRAGLAATLIGLATAILIARPSRRTVPLAMAAAAILATASLLSLTGLRATALPDDLGIRTAIWQASAAIALDHLWLGLGSLDRALQMQPGDWGERHILRAHNIYLQAIAERGLPATIAALSAVALALAHSARGLRNRHPADRVRPAIAFSATALFASHGLVDFSLYAPTNAAILSLLLGMACATLPPALPRRQGFATNAQPFQS